MIRPGTRPTLNPQIIQNLTLTDSQRMIPILMIMILISMTLMNLMK